MKDLAKILVAYGTAAAGTVFGLWGAGKLVEKLEKKKKQEEPAK